jgi:hypothetical protein
LSGDIHLSSNVGEQHFVALSALESMAILDEAVVCSFDFRPVLSDFGVAARHLESSARDDRPQEGNCMSFKARFLRIVLAVFLVEAFVARNAFAQSYSFEPLAEPNAAYAIGYGMNSLGEIVGTVATSPSNAFNTFVDNKGAFQTLDFPSSYAYAQANGINKSQLVVGWWEGSGGDSGALFNSFVSTQSSKKPRSFVSFGYPSASATMANGVNDGSEVVGSFTDSSGVVHGFTYKSQKFATLDHPVGVSTVANAINNSGEIVGYYEDSSDGLHGFTSVKGNMTSIDFPTSVGATEATGVNNSGVVVGIYGQFTGGMPQAQGFVLSKGTYSTIDYPGAMGTYLVGVNTSGNILGYYYGSSCSAPPLDVTDHPCGFIATPAGKAKK